jgi:hypothetical protein
MRSSRAGRDELRRSTSPVESRRTRIGSVQCRDHRVRGDVGMIEHLLLRDFADQNHARAGGQAATES